MIKKNNVVKKQMLLLLCAMCISLQLLGCQNDSANITESESSNDVEQTYQSSQYVDQTSQYSQYVEQTYQPSQYMSGDPEPVKHDKIQIGNTFGNILNNGLVVQVDDWVYYSNSADEWKIYKKRIDGSENTKVSDYAGWGLNVIDDWIYYADMTEGENWFMCRVNIDDKTDEVLTDNPAINIIATKDWIYYLDGYHLYKTTPDGNVNISLTNQFVYHFLLYDDVIFYKILDENNSNAIYKMNTDGSNREKIYEGNLSIFHIDSEWLYVKNLEDEKKLYRISRDGSRLEKVIDLSFSYMNIYDDWVYYVDEDGIYKISLSGEHNMKLTDDTGTNINVIDGWVYYRCSTILKRVKMDGTETQVFD